MKDKFEKWTISTLVGIPLLFVAGLLMNAIFPAGFLGDMLHTIISLGVGSAMVSAGAILISSR